MSHCRCPTCSTIAVVGCRANSRCAKCTTSARNRQGRCGRSTILSWSANHLSHSAGLHPCSTRQLASQVMVITIPTCIATAQHHPHGVIVLTTSDSISIVILIVMSSKFPMNHQQHPQASSSRSYSSPPSASSSQPKPHSSSPCTPDGKLGHLFQREAGRVQIVCEMHSSCVACKQSANTNLPT